MTDRVSLPTLTHGKFTGRALTHITTLTQQATSTLKTETAEALAKKADQNTLDNFIGTLTSSITDSEAKTALASTQAAVSAERASREEADSALADRVSALEGAEVDLTPYATKEELEKKTVGIPIFPTLAEALAWEAKNPGKTALTTEPQTPDTAPPSAGTLTVTTSNTSAMLTVTGARDDRAIAGYSFRVGSGTWSPWQASASFTATGLTATTGYTFTHRVKDAAENITVGAPVQATTTATPALKPGDIFTSDTFTGTGSLVGQMTSAALGGTPVKWEGAAGMNVEGSKAVAGASAAGKATLAAGLADVKIEFTLVARPTTGTATISLRDTAGGRVVINFLSTSVRIQRFSTTAGNTLLSGTQIGIGDASLGAKFTLTLKGESITFTGTDKMGMPFSLTATDAGHLVAGDVGVQADAGSGFAIDDLVVTAQ